MRVKICGITTREDARDALDAGADAIGMVLHPGSPRQVSFQQAREISDYVGGAADRFGVLVDAGPAELAEMAAACHLTALQLHLRSCPRELITHLPVPILPYLRGDRLALRRSAEWWPTLPVLVDSLTSEGAGGSEVTRRGQLGQLRQTRIHQHPDPVGGRAHIVGDLPRLPG